MIEVIFHSLHKERKNIELQSPLTKVAMTILDQSVHVHRNEKIFVQYNSGAIELFEEISKLALKRKIHIRGQPADSFEIANNLKDPDHGKVTRYINDMAKLNEENIIWANKTVYIRSNDFPHAFDDVPLEVDNEYNQAFVHASKIRDRKPWCVTCVPTKAEAEEEKINYQDYLKMYSEACNRNWKKIHRAQDVLIKKILNPGKELTLKAGRHENGSRDTDLKMSIAGQTFANETIELNVPGSEVFSSPVRGTISGRLTIPYSINLDNHIVPNLTLTFAEGKVVKVEVKNPDQISNNVQMEELVNSILDSTPGMREVGEVAFGTNRAFNRALINPLFVEKVGGSFHIALGDSFKYLNNLFAGKKVKVDNEVESNKHNDLTCIMLPEYGGGEVYVDGKLIQKDGEFLDPRLKALNEKN